MDEDTYAGAFVGRSGPDRTLTASRGPSVIDNEAATARPGPDSLIERCHWPDKKRSGEYLNERVARGESRSPTNRPRGRFTWLINVAGSIYTAGYRSPLTWPDGSRRRCQLTFDDRSFACIPLARALLSCDFLSGT